MAGRRHRPGPRFAVPGLAGAARVAAARHRPPHRCRRAQPGGPQLDTPRHIAAGGSTTSVPRALFLVLVVLQVGPWLLPVWVTGLVRLGRDRGLRCFAVACVVLAVVFLVLGGKPYYLGGLVPLLLAAGAQPVVDRLPRWGPAV